MNFIYVIHMLYGNHLITHNSSNRNNQWQQQQQGARASRAPSFVVFVATVVSVASVATAVCDQVVTVQHVDDIDEVHQLDPVHQVDHKDELWGDPGANFSCFFSEVITFCALVSAPLWARSSILGPWLGGQVSENNHRDHQRAQRIVFCIEFCKFGTQFWLVGTHHAIPAIPAIPRIRDGGRRSDPG